MVSPQAASDHIQLLFWSVGTWNSSLTPKSGDVFNPHEVLCSLEAPPWRGNTEHPSHKANPKFNPVLPSVSSLPSQSRHILSSRKASPCWHSNAQPGLFQLFFAQNPWKELPVGHTAQLAPSLLPGHLIHPLPRLPQAAPAQPEQNLMEHFSAQHPLTLGASFCAFFPLISLCSVAVTSTQTVFVEDG